VGFIAADESDKIG